MFLYITNSYVIMVIQCTVIYMYHYDEYVWLINMLSVMSHKWIKCTYNINTVCKISCREVSAFRGLGFAYCRRIKPQRP